MAPQNISDREVAALKAELRELRKLKDGLESRGKAKSKMRVFLMKLWAGPGLTNSLENWMEVKDSADVDQATSATANLIAAIFRRFMRVGFIFIIFATIPILLIIWQITIMKQQNQSLIKQIETQRIASTNQQVTEYLRLLLSSDEKEVTAAEGFLVSDVVNRDIAVERLAALIKSGNAEVQCSALKALNRVVESSTELTLKAALSPNNPDRAIVRDLQCAAIDFSSVDFGPITFIDTGFPASIFELSKLSQVEFQESNLRHSDFTQAQLCKADKLCVRFLDDTDLSYSQFTFSKKSQDVFGDGMILRGAQLKLSQGVSAQDPTKRDRSGTKQITAASATPSKFARENIVTRGICYESSFSQCYLYHKAKDLGQLSDQKLSTLRQNSCPVNLDGPIVLTSITSCETLGLQPRW